MLAEENKNAGTSALEGKEELQGLIALSPAPLICGGYVSWSKEEKERKEGCFGIWNASLSVIKSLML